MSSFFENVVNTWGEEGEKWFESLPILAKKISLEWGLSDLEEVYELSFNYVVSCKYQGKPAVLKLRFNKDSLKREVLTLNFYKGPGCVKVLRSDLSSGALLLEQIVPGQFLKTFFPDRDEEAVGHVAKIMNHIHSKTWEGEPGFLNCADRLALLDEIEDGIPKTHLEKARVLKKKLLETSDRLVLLHGDLHYENILSSNTVEKWIVIDPKGIIGERAYEVGMCIVNPIHEILEQSNSSEIISKRLKLFSQLLNLDMQRTREWSYVIGILAATHAMQNDKLKNKFIRVAEIVYYC